jgi:ATP-dependent RNA helicase DHX57
MQTRIPIKFWLLILEPPANKSVDFALLRLKDVGALDADNELTPLGGHLAALPLDVRTGNLMVFGAIFCCVDSAMTIAACLGYRSHFVTPFAHHSNLMYVRGCLQLVKMIS